MRKVKAPYIGIDQEHHMEVISPELAGATLKNLDFEHNVMKRGDAEDTLRGIEEKPVDPTKSKLAAALIWFEDGHLNRAANSQILRGDSIHTAQGLLAGEIAPQDADPKHIRVANKLMKSSHKNTGRLFKSIEKDLLPARILRDIRRTSVSRPVKRLVRSVEGTAKRNARPHRASRSPQREVNRVLKATLKRY